MENVIIILVLAAILGGAIGYIVKAKKRGQTCIGCPAACSCASKSGCPGGCGGCGSHEN